MPRSIAERTAATRLVETPDYSHGFTVVDYDSDGWPDLFLSCYGHSRLYRNLGDGTFADPIPVEQFPALGWGTSAGWGDIDRDGDKRTLSDGDLVAISIEGDGPTTFLSLHGPRAAELAQEVEKA